MRGLVALFAIVIAIGCDTPADMDEPGESITGLDDVVSTERPTKRSEVYGVADEESNTRRVGA